MSASNGKGHCPKREDVRVRANACGAGRRVPRSRSVAIPAAANRWDGVTRPYSSDDVERLRGSIRIAHTLADRGARRLWDLMHTTDYVHALGAVTGNQAMQQVRAGLKAIYVSGWQVAADANVSGNMYPDQSLYPVNSVPALVKRINQALERADQIETAEAIEAACGLDGSPATKGGNESHQAVARLNGNGASPDTAPDPADRDWFAPIVADAEAGFGGPLNVFELMKGMIEAGAAGVHFEDQLSSEKKCGHLGGKVLVPTSQFVHTLIAARLAADVMDVSTLVIARTDANSAQLITSDVDPRDHPYLTGERTPEGFFRITGGLECAIARGLAYAPYADLIWCETSTPCLEEARRFADAIHARFPGKLLAYNCSPSFNWQKNLDDATIAAFQRELGRMGYKFQFVTLAGFHQLNHGMFELARGYATDGMTAYSKLQRAEFDSEARGYTATRHQREVGTGYFDLVNQVISGGECSTLALETSTEAAQF